jgi:hypothetical protein
MRTESQDSEHTVSEAAVRKTVAPDEHAAAESPTPEIVVTVAASPSKEVARASTAPVAALILSSHQSVSPHAALSSCSQRLDDDVLREFDATRRLSKLTMDWGVLAAGAASFGEKL